MTMIRTAEHARHLFGHDMKPCFFINLAHNRLGWRFTGVNRATRCTPRTVITSFLQKNAPVIIVDNRHYARIEN